MRTYRLLLLTLTPIFLCASLKAAPPQAPTNPVNVFEITPSNTMKAFPSQVLVVTFPNNKEKDWKELQRGCLETEGIIEFIPSDELENAQSKIITIQYSQFPQNIVFNADEFTRKVRSSTLAKNPGTFFQVIDTYQNSSIYEIVFRDENRNIDEHNIARVFASNGMLHHIAYAKQDGGAFSPNDRNEVIHLLQKNVSLMSLEQAIQSPGLSIANKIQHTVSLGYFHDWHKKETAINTYGYSYTTYTPPQNFSASEGFLDITSMANGKALKPRDFLKIEKNKSSAAFQTKIKSKIIKETPSEIIYTFTTPLKEEGLQINKVFNIVRIFVTPQAYYSVAYRCMQPNKMSQEEINQWQSRLETVVFVVD